MPTILQQQTRWRNDKIRRLRGLWVNSTLMEPGIATQVQHLIDMQLRRWDAQPEAERRAEDRAALTEGTGYYKGFGKRRKFFKYEDS